MAPAHGRPAHLPGMYLVAPHTRLGGGFSRPAMGGEFARITGNWARRYQPYHDLGVDWHTRRNDQAHGRRLVAQLERLGYTVIIDPAA